MRAVTGDQTFRTRLKQIWGAFLSAGLTSKIVTVFSP